MNTFSRLNIIATVTLTLLVGGCAYNVDFKSTYLPPAEPSGKVDESVLIFMTEEQGKWVYSGHPTSFTGSATTLTVPLGNITKQVALIVFSRYFDQVDAANNMEQSLHYRVVVKPDVQHFEYAYKSLKNLGFAITPAVVLDLHVTWYDTTGKALRDKIYYSEEIEGESYIFSGRPEEKLNQLLHKLLADLMTLAAQETIELVNVR